MKRISFLLAIGTGLLLASCNLGNPKILVFTKTSGFVHSSIPNGVAAIQKLGKQNGFDVDTTSNSDLFIEENLKNYSAVVFLNTTGDVLNARQEAAFERFIQAGGGFAGVHAATDTEYGWGWYGKLVGAYFHSHPKVQEAKFLVKDNTFAATSFIKTADWTRTDELYNFKKINPNINVVMTIDESTYEGGNNGENHPMSWYHEYDGGRAFYTAMGHTEESYEDEDFLKHLLGGIQYAMGKNSKLDYSKAHSQMPPDTDRFSKKVLSSGKFFEPTEMTILPNRDVLIAQRRGEIYHYKHETGELKEAITLDVYFRTNVKGVNAEEGLMGLQKDPNYAENSWVYAFYAPTGSKWVNRLSRFQFKDDVFDKTSEQIILEFYSQRDICCHTGGSIAFDKDGLLYLSTGDNATPFDEKGAKYVNNGYAPLNPLPGKQQYDARRSSGNTNDLRGKIIRIKVNEDGSYDIPAGNLFPEGTPSTRPEIYTMGHRNPYRISVDPKKGYVYWGEVGPDSRTDNFEKRGPRGYDEMNQAKGPGNFGWPLFVGDNYPYREYNYATGESGDAFDPAKPMNTSANNTGMQELPPAQAPYLFYDYQENKDYPGLKSGGRNAMAGPVYYADLYPNNPHLPDYYDKKVIIYDWIRGWMKAAHFFDNGDFNKIEPFAADIELNNPIDMEIGPEGRIYILEYGRGWFSANDDSGLGFIEYNGGNRPPVIEGLSTDHNSGNVPLTVNVSVDAMDKEKDALNYVWDMGDGNKKETSSPSITYTYDSVGEYLVSVEVIDSKDASTSSEVLPIVAGNTRPELEISLKGGNSSFFLPGQALNYKVSVSDQEDGEEINLDNVFVSVDYMEGMDAASVSAGHQEVSAEIMGKSLTMTLDCRSCHKENEKSIGPSYMQVAEKHRRNRGIVSYLKKKIREGGAGVWGEVPMAAHPDISDLELSQIVAYIQSLIRAKSGNISLPAEGSVVPGQDAAGKTMILTASYTDKGGKDGAKALTGATKVALNSNVVAFREENESEGFMNMEFGGNHLLIASPGGGWFALEDIDLTGIKSISLGTGWQAPPGKNISLRVYAGSPEGDLLGSGTLLVNQMTKQGGLLRIPLKSEQAKKYDKLYFVYAPSETERLAEGQRFAFMNVIFGAE